ncbi:MAG: hypothetical protein MZV63_18945 [Marinilabiliales bacterium]|nr:hypothetical protein [Marinilabiliales bacterium]
MCRTEEHQVFWQLDGLCQPDAAGLMASTASPPMWQATTVHILYDTARFNDEKLQKLLFVPVKRAIKSPLAGDADSGDMSTLPDNR